MKSLNLCLPESFLVIKLLLLRRETFFSTFFSYFSLPMSLLSYDDSNVLWHHMTQLINARNMYVWMKALIATSVTWFWCLQNALATHLSFPRIDSSHGSGVEIKIIAILHIFWSNTRCLFHDDVGDDGVTPSLWRSPILLFLPIFTWSRRRLLEYVCWHSSTQVSMTFSFSSIKFRFTCMERDGVNFSLHANPAGNEEEKLLRSSREPKLLNFLLK